MWIKTNGVAGRLVTGKGDYADRSIFLPAAGYGDGSYFTFPGSHGIYWSSSPYSDYAGSAWFLEFIDSASFYQYNDTRIGGHAIRAVRRFAK